MKRCIIHVHGKVQDVGFRFTAKEKAHSLHLAGFIRNESDGSVYIEAEGEMQNLRELLDWCAKGYHHARVEKVSYQSYDDLKHFTNFLLL